MKEYTFKTRQIALFFIAFTPLIKFFTMPSLLSSTAKNDLLFSLLIPFTFEVLTLGIIIFTMKNYNGTFIEFLKEQFGETGFKIVLILYAVCFFAKALLPICEQKDYIELTLYQTNTNPLSFLTFILISFYLATKKFRVLGRLSDVCFIITLVGYVVLMGLSISNADYGSILPIGINGIKNIVKGAFSCFTWFGDAVYLLFFMGNFEYQKKSGKKIFLSYLLSMLLVIIFFYVFYGTFTSIAFRQRFALTEISKYSSVINNVGRFDYIAIFLILTANVFSISIPIYFCCKLLSITLPIKQKWIYPVIVHVAIFIIITFFREHFFTIEKLQENVFSFIYPIFYYVLPTIFCFMIICKKQLKEGYEKS